MTSVASDDRTRDPAGLRAPWVALLASLGALTLAASVLADFVIDDSPASSPPCVVPLLIVAACTVTCTAIGSGTPRALLGSAVAAASTACSLLVLATGGMDIPAGDAVGAASLAQILGLALAWVSPDGWATAILPRGAVAPAARFVTLSAASAAVAVFPALAAGAAAGPHAALFALSFLSAAMTLGLTAASAHALLATRPRSNTRWPAALLDRFAAPAVAAAAAVLALRSSAAPALPVGAAWLATPFACAAAVGVLLADVSLTLAISAAPVFVALAAAALAPASGGTAATVTPISGASLLLLVALVSAGSNAAVGRHALSAAARIGWTVALALVASSPFGQVTRLPSRNARPEILFVAGP